MSTPSYRLADLSPDQMGAIERLENNIHVTLIAYQPMSDAVRDSATAAAGPGEDNEALDALNDTYRTFDPLI
ncbi:MAG TPA: hypothetical protein VGK74_03480 [Symbiobacteriaceae bacterium]